MGDWSSTFALPILKPYQGVAIIESKKALWGGYSLVDAELRGLKQLLKMNRSWTHYINLSGQDFPLKSQAYIRDFLRANPRRQYIRALDQRAIRPDTRNRDRKSKRLNSSH